MASCSQSHESPLNVEMGRDWELETFARILKLPACLAAPNRITNYRVRAAKNAGADFSGRLFWLRLQSARGFGGRADIQRKFQISQRSFQNRRHHS
jgi:hypothetical protein